jgi:RNA polymerase sigma factor (sigma-70 family)
MIDDAELLRRYHEDASEAAFAEVVRRHVDHVYSSALRLVGGDAHRAEDVAQMVFVSLARKSSKLTQHPVIAGWLYTATHHAAAQVVRGESRRRRREEEAHLMNECLKDDAATAEADWIRVRPVLDAALQALNERDRAAVVLRFFAQRPFADIGRALRVSEDAARMRVERAVEKLRTQLIRRGVSSSVGALVVALETQVITAAPASLAASITSAACIVATSLSGTAGLFAHLMAETKVIVGAAGLVACLVGTIVLNQHLERRRAETALEQATRAAVVQTREIQAITHRVADVEEAATESGIAVERRKADAAALHPAAIARSAPGTLARRGSSIEAGNAFLKRHPEVKAALDAWADAGVDGVWRAFYRQRGLTAAQIEEFRFLVRPRSFIPNAEPDGQLLQLFTGAYFSDEEIERRLRALLGEEGFSEYRLQAKNLPARQMAGEVAGALCFSEAPLLSAQHIRLVETMARHRKAPEPASRSPISFDWAAIAGDAAGFLSPPQLTALEAVRAHAAFQDRWSRAPNPTDAATETVSASKSP